MSPSRRPGTGDGPQAPTAREPDEAPGPVVLRPDRGAAAGWSAVGALATGVALWLVVDTRGHPLALGLLLACALLSAPFVAQLATPERTAWRFDERGLLLRGPRGAWRVDWDRIRLARVVRRLGEPALELRVEDDPSLTRTWLLPVGADARALHAVLATHLRPCADGGDAPAADTGADPPPSAAE